MSVGEAYAQSRFEIGSLRPDASAGSFEVRRSGAFTGRVNGQVLLKHEFGIALGRVGKFFRDPCQPFSNRWIAGLPRQLRAIVRALDGNIRNMHGDQTLS